MTRINSNPIEGRSERYNIMNSLRTNGLRREPLIEVINGMAEGETCPACNGLAAYVDDEVQWHKTRCGLANRERLRRIHIVGGPGSGKTTLAHEIGTRLGIQVHELDSIAFMGPDYAERGLSERLADISTIASQPTWIVEGFFVLWTDQLLECADIIVWLDNISWERSRWRTVRRFIRSALREAKIRRGLAKFTRFHDYAHHLKLFIRAFFSSRTYYVASAHPPDGQIESRQNTTKHLTMYKDKVIHCYSDEAVKQFLNYIYHCS